MTRLRFTPAERSRLTDARRRVATPWTIVYCVWENHYARSGGVAAVARELPAAFAAAGANVLVVSPWHSSLSTAVAEPAWPRAGITVAATTYVDFDGQRVPLRVLESREPGVRRIYLDAPGWFTADGGTEQKDPYIYSFDPCGTLDECTLLHDSLFACAAVPPALAAIGLVRDLVVHAQDWQFASLALTVKLAILDGTIDSAVTLVTSHNPYDHQLKPTALRLLTDRKPRDPLPDSVYSHMLPLVDGPVSTVSGKFARELTTEPLLTAHFTPHLQELYREKGVIGIANGRFGSVQTAPASKRERRASMLAALASFSDARAFGSLHAVGDQTPVFFMFGRFDPGQKGFDLFARAIEAMPPGMARFVLAPQIRDAAAFRGDNLYVEDLRRLAAARRGEVVVYPFRMDAQIYSEIMSGASWVVMPSFYEPFGAATEPYLAGTPVIARATGGLVEQVIDGETGLLFRETYPGVDAAAQWNAIEKSADPWERMAVPLYGAMVAALAAALVRGAVLYSEGQETYRAMLANLAEKADQFDWSRTAARYMRWFADAIDR